VQRRYGAGLKVVLPEELRAPPLILVTPAATPVDETKSPFRFSRKGLERSNLN